jgi:hypothetical protein
MNRRAGAAYRAIVNRHQRASTIAREHIQPPPGPPALERIERDVLTHNASPT